MATRREKASSNSCFHTASVGRLKKFVWSWKTSPPTMPHNAAMDTAPKIQSTLTTGLSCLDSEPMSKDDILSHLSTAFQMEACLDRVLQEDGNTTSENVCNFVRKLILTVLKTQPSAIPICGVLALKYGTKTELRTGRGRLVSCWRLGRTWKRSSSVQFEGLRIEVNMKDWSHVYREFDFGSALWKRSSPQTALE